MTTHLDRAFLLIQQSRYLDAEQHLRQQLLENPEDATAHALLALCLSEREEFEQAAQEAQRAIGSDPNDPLGYYALARVMLDRNRLTEAQQAIEQSIQLDPFDASSLALLANIHHRARRWGEALKAAEQGLEVDPEHVGCANLRALALTKLGRRSEAGTTLDSLLAKAPEDPVAHANRGWALLETGDHPKALEHFREALRLDPEFEWARHGIVEAMKARYLVYRYLLRFFLFMSRLSTGAQWGILIGLFVLMRVLRSVARQNEEFAPFIVPILVVYVLFALMTWIATPLFNLLLRLNRFGRLALSREETIASNWLGGVLLGAILFGVAALALQSSLLIVGAIVCLGLLVPVAGTFRCDRGWPRTLMAGYTGLVALVGFGALAGLLLNFSVVQGLASLFLLGVIGSSWIGNILGSITPRR